jgi:dihydropyrimidinase
MTAFDTVIRHGTVVTASDTFEADVGISEGKIQAIARNLPTGKKTIDARGKLVLPGGVDAHCHIDQPTSDGSVCACNLLWTTTTAGPGARR